MLFFVTPQSHFVDPEDAYVEYKRREYVAALQEQQRRTQFQRELELEEQRHRIALANIAQQEAARRRRQQVHPQRRDSVPVFAFGPSQAQQQQASQGCAGRSCRQPVPEEILKRRQARQEEEERRARAFHEQVLSQIFGVSVDGQEGATPTAAASKQDKGKGRATDAATTSDKAKDADAQPHWSAAPERARSLAEITSINRTFASLRNTFVFPTGELERLSSSQDDAPRLAYNTTNATIHAYDHALSELLTKLDGIESHGFKGVREARKQLVVRIEQELERVEKLVAERLAGAASPVLPTAEMEVHVPIEDAATPTQTLMEKETEDVEMEHQGAPVTTTEVTNEVSGYDFEPEEVIQDTIPEQAVTESVSQDHAEKQLDTLMDVEVAATIEDITPRATAPAPVSDLQVPIDAENVHQNEAISAPEVSAPTAPESVDPTVAPASEPASEPAHTFPPTAVLDVSNTSDEESEVEDAIHVEISSDDDLVESDHDTFEML